MASPSRHYHIREDRVIFQSESDNFETWDPIPWLALQPDQHDRENVQFYGGAAFWYESLFLGYIEVFYVNGRRLNTQFIASRDGRKWERIGFRETFIENGHHGEFDGYWSFPVESAPHRIGDDLCILYSGRADPHSPPTHVAPGMRGAIGLARLRPEGFVSIDMTGGEGLVLTKPFRFEKGSRLTVNACPMVAQAGWSPMQLSVEVLDANAAPIPGYSGADALAFSGDSLAHEVKWKKRASVRALTGKPVRLLFKGKNARLYSFRVS